MSSILFHGPDAYQAAMTHSQSGVLMADPFGLDGLKVDDAREAVSTLLSIPIGNRKGFVIIGPMDMSNPKASDVLLKTLEEHSFDYVQPILWADDISNVALTIRSRCVAKFCPQVTDVTYEEDLVGKSWELIFAIKAKEYYKVPLVISQIKKDIQEFLPVFLSGFQMNLADDTFREIWMNLRMVLSYKNVTQTELVSVLLKHLK
jgi:hypothetical protein